MLRGSTRGLSWIPSVGNCSKMALPCTRNSRKEKKNLLVEKAAWVKNHNENTFINKLSKIFLDYYTCLISLRFASLFFLPLICNIYRVMYRIDYFLRAWLCIWSELSTICMNYDISVAFFHPIFCKKKCIVFLWDFQITKWLNNGIGILYEKVLKLHQYNLIYSLCVCISYISASSSLSIRNSWWCWFD